jgi:hypothetical protein
MLTPGWPSAAALSSKGHNIASLGPVVYHDQTGIHPPEAWN